MGNLASLEQELTQVVFYKDINDEEHIDWPCQQTIKDLRHYVIATESMRANNEIPIVHQMIDCVKNGTMAHFTKIVESHLDDEMHPMITAKIISLFNDADLSNTKVLDMMRWVINHPKIPLFAENFNSGIHAAEIIGKYANEKKMEAYIDRIKVRLEQCESIRCNAENCVSHSVMNELLIGAIRRNMPSTVRKILVSYYTVPYSICEIAFVVAKPAVILELLSKFPSSVLDPVALNPRMKECVAYATDMSAETDRSLIDKIFFLILVGKFDDAKRLTLKDPRTCVLEYYWWSDISVFLSNHWNSHYGRRHFVLHYWFIVNTKMIIHMNLCEIDERMFQAMSADNLEMAFDRWQCYRVNKWFAGTTYVITNPPPNSKIPDEYLRECVNRICSEKFFQKLVKHVGKKRFLSPDVYCAILKSESPMMVEMFGKQ